MCRLKVRRTLYASIVIHLPAARLRAGQIVLPGLLTLFFAVLGLSYYAGTQLSGIQESAAVATAAPAGTGGTALFAGNCAGCHGVAGGGGIGPKLAGLVKPWSAAEFDAAVLDGHAPGGRILSAMMPHFRTAGLDGQPPSEAQMADLYAFVRGL
ncbi:cytochrome c [Deinococcus detaillensis]|uniref:Cytochrome c n=1 Tax=Deinococcus detaillensis TaxID=2592048 RepID=A0A553UPA6_9DEIO|nr:cytochrome c [Deinococcus detaillensis]